MRGHCRYGRAGDRDGPGSANLRRTFTLVIPVTRRSDLPRRDRHADGHRHHFLFGAGYGWLASPGRSRVAGIATTSGPTPEDQAVARRIAGYSTLTGNVPMPDITETLAFPAAFVTAVAVVAPT